MGQQTQRRMKQTKMYVCTLVEFISSSRCSHVAVQVVSDGLESSLAYIQT